MDLSGRSTARGTPSRIGLLVLSTLLVVWSCDDSDIRPVYPRALCGPDTLELGAPLVLDFYYDAATGGHLESYSWVAVEDTLLELVLLYSYEERSGCSANEMPSSFPVVGTAVLNAAPARTFSVRAGSLLLEIPVATTVEPDNRLRITLVDAQDQGIAGVGGFLNTAGPVESIRLEPTDPSGMILVRQACEQPGTSFWVSLHSGESSRQGDAEAHWPAECTSPRHLRILGR